MLARISIRWRIFLFHLLTMLAIVLVLAVGVLIVFNIAVSENVEQLAQARSNEAARIVERTGTLTPDDLAELSDDRVVIIATDDTGQIVTQSGNGLPANAHIDETTWERAASSGEGAGSLPDRGLHDYALWDNFAWYLHVEPVQPNEGPIRLIGAAVNYDKVGGGQFSNVTVTFGGLSILAFLLITVGSWILVRYSLAPVTAIAKAAEEISDRDLSRRLPVRDDRDELGHLATTFNHLLARLEVAFQHRETMLRHQRQFVADASHELRTPLTSILGYTRMLKTWGLRNPEAAREAITQLEQQATRMEALVEGLLHLAREDEGVAQLVRSEVNLNQIVAEAIAAQETVTPNARIEAGLPGHAVMVQADGDQIRQVLDILLSNAVKYSPEGMEITVGLRSVGDQAQLVVKDQGPGIAPEDQQRIFERFYRVDTSRTARGTGLGLAIAASIAQRHGGNIGVVSTPGEGAAFIFRLPLGAERHDQPETEG